MQRGVLSLTNQELEEIFKKIDVEKYAGSLLHSKLSAAKSAGLTEVKLELSEDELETLLDDLDIPNPDTDSQELMSLRNKISLMLSGFRTS
jgi:hypothetical protein